MALACVVSLTPVLKGGVFKFIQEFQGYISPGILAAFVFGFAVKKAPPAAGVAALVASAPVYGIMQLLWGDVPYLHRMSWTLGVLVAVMAVITAVAPLKEPKVLPVRREMDVRTEPVVYAWGALVMLAVVAFFWVLR
jgi:SSS family solute:Na+ symporter